jgi:hypothetical protein
MGRKLCIMVALISLVLLAQAVPGLADMVLPGGNVVNWEAYSHVDGVGSLGDAGNLYQAGYPYIGAWGGWRIAQLLNQNAVEPTPIDGGSTVAITYDTIRNGDYIYNIDEQQPYIPTKFAVWTTDASNNYIPVLASADFQVTVIAKYNQDSVMTEGSIYGVGTNWLDNGAQFTLTGTLVPTGEMTDDEPIWVDGQLIGLETVVLGNHGYFTDLQLNSAAAPTPIPGSVWLLSTGLLGLACAGRYRKS